MIIVAAKIWYLKKCAVFIGPPFITLESAAEPQSVTQLS